MSSHAALDYGFARRHGVLRLAGDGVRVALREGADPMALLEARRVLGQPIAVQALPRAEFDRRLSEIYAGDALQGGALAGDAGNASLDALAQEHAHTLPRPILRVLEGLGALRGSGAALASYLLFEPEFISALMALGQADVQARADEILAFLVPTGSHPVR